jgi:hypothetical protein
MVSATEADHLEIQDILPEIGSGAETDREVDLTYLEGLLARYHPVEAPVLGLSCDLSIPKRSRVSR